MPVDSLDWKRLVSRTAAASNGLMDLSTLGKWIVISGLGLIVIGLLLWLAGKSGLPLGNLPGDFGVDRPGFSFRFPLVSGIVISIVLTLILNIVLWFFRR
jgi:hypothetical protein